MSAKEVFELSCYRATSYDASGALCYIDWKSVIDALDIYLKRFKQESEN